MLCKQLKMFSASGIFVFRRRNLYQRDREVIFKKGRGHAEPCPADYAEASSFLSASFSFSRFLNAVDSISLILFSWFTSLAPGSKSIATILDCGYSRRSSLITPFPTTWFGRQAKGCVHTIFPAPLWISSSILRSGNHPSDRSWFPMETISDGHLCQILNVCRRIKVLTVRECSGSRRTKPFYCFDAEISISALDFLNPRWDTP